MDAALSKSGPGAWLRKFGQLAGAFRHKNLLKNFPRGTPGSQNSCGPVQILVRSLCRVSAQEVPWESPGRRSGPPPKNVSNTSHTAPQGHIIYLVR